MKLIPQSVKILAHTTDSWYNMEYAARTCTATTDRMRKDPDFLINSIIKRKHYSILEHASVTFELTTSRAIANQIVRHRMQHTHRNPCAMLSSLAKVTASQS